MTMSSDNWNNLPKDLLVFIVQLLTSQEDYYRFSSVCKSWNSAATEDEFLNPWWLPTTTPMLLLAEQVAPGSILYDTELNKDYGDSDEEGITKDDDDAPPFISSYDYLKDSIGTSRGLYSLSTMKTYDIELPEAAGKQILGTSKGWLLTIGRDFQINLLHPLSRYQFPLPPMLAFPIDPQNPQYFEDYNADHTANFIQKVAMSSRLLKDKIDVNFFHHHATPSPIVMAVYGGIGSLAFARLGDKVWTKVQVQSDGNAIHDIVYHKGNFYGVNAFGDVYVFCIDSDEEKGGPRGTKIASIRSYGEYQNKYLVEPLSGSGLLVIVRYSMKKFFKKGKEIVSKYRTTRFAVWRLDLNYNDSLEIPSCTLTEEHNLGNAAIFLGRASSFSVSSSEIIKPNSIYFTDDRDGYIWLGGGHDMGIFDLERRTIEPHFQGKSIHCIAPPLWYI